MDNKKILSLIIPVYNVDKYLDACLNSVFLQWDHTLEVIVINDGSTDNSADIIQKYKNKYKLTYVTQENSGLSAARNKGISISKGKYIAFLDSDDLWSDGIYNAIKEILLKNDPDCIVFNYSEIIDDKEQSFKFIKENKLITNDLDFTKLKLAKSGVFYAWRYIFKKNIFDGTGFDVGRRFEDQLLIPMLIYKCQSIFESRKNIVKYRQIASSITKNLNIADIDDSEFGLRRYRDKYAEWRSRYWAVILASLFLSHVSKCARLYHIDKYVALKSFNKAYDIVSLKPILYSGKLKPILYYLFKYKLFFRLISSVEHEVRK